MPRLRRLLAEEKETQDRSAFVSSASSSPPFPSSPPLLLSFISYSPCYPTHQRVYCCIIPNGLIVVFFMFRPSLRAPCAWRPLFRLRHLRTFWFSGLLVQEVDWYIMCVCDSVGAVGLRASFPLRPSSQKKRSGS